MDDKNQLVPEINYTKTVARQPLIYNISGLLKLENILLNVWLFALICSLLFVSIEEVVDLSYINAVIAPSLSAYLIVNVLFHSVLAKIKAKQILMNNEKTITALKFF